MSLIFKEQLINHTQSRIRKGNFNLWESFLTPCVTSWNSCPMINKLITSLCFSLQLIFETVVMRLQNPHHV
jgi:hypothetical protein